MKRRYSLKGRTLFKETYADGKKFHLKGLTLYIKRIENTGNTKTIRFGIVTKKKIGNAVFRNFIKRRIRSICREYIPQIDINCNIILIPGIQICKSDYDILQVTLEALFKKAGIII